MSEVLLLCSSVSEVLGAKIVNSQATRRSSYGGLLSMIFPIRGMCLPQGFVIILTSPRQEYYPALPSDGCIYFTLAFPTCEHGINHP